MPQIVKLSFNRENYREVRVITKKDSFIATETRLAGLVHKNDLPQCGYKEGIVTFKPISCSLGEENNITVLNREELEARIYYILITSCPEIVFHVNGFRAYR